MRAISLWQPWASAVAVGSKRYETRSWSFPKAFAGTRIAIHAAKRWQLEEREWAETLQFNGFNLGFDGEPPLGCIVAVATLGDCLPAEALYGPGFAPFADWDDPEQVEYQLGDFAPGRWAWELTEVTRLAEPVPCRGQQGFWSLEPDIECAVLRSLDDTGGLK